jgi:hypothetical protein
MITAAVGAAATVELDITPQLALEAVTLGQAGLGGGRSAFHAPYRLGGLKPPLDSVEIVTPFRRVEIAAELRARVGDRRFGQREGLAVAAAHPGQISVHAEFTFHPQNTYALVPQYRMVWMTRTGERIEPANTESAPRFAARTGGDALPVPLELAPGAAIGQRPGTGSPLLGATVVTYFGGRRVADPQDPGVELLIEEAGRGELARLPIDVLMLR